MQPSHVDNLLPPRETRVAAIAAAQRDPRTPDCQPKVPFEAPRFLFLKLPSSAVLSEYVMRSPTKHVTSLIMGFSSLISTLVWARFCREMSTPVLQQEEKTERAAVEYRWAVDRGLCKNFLAAELQEKEGKSRFLFFLFSSAVSQRLFLLYA